MNPCHSVWETVTVLLTRGLSAAEVAQGLDLPEWEVSRVARDLRINGSRDLYISDCLNRTNGDPCKLEAAVYLYVRGVPWADALDHVRLTMGGNRRWRAPVEAREAYRKTQLRRAVAGVLS